MDPVSREVQRIIERLEGFSVATPSVLEVLADPKDQVTVCAALRAWEWSPQARSPVLILTAASEGEFDTIDALTGAVRTHHAALSRGLEKVGKLLPPLPAPHAGGHLPMQIIALIEAFSASVGAAISDPVICWIPANVRNSPLYVTLLEALLRNPTLAKSRLIFSNTPDRAWTTGPLRLGGREVATLPVAVDDATVQSHFLALFAAPAAGRARGTLPGSAAPDVEPPPRLGRREPSEDEVRAALAEVGAPPQLSVSQAEELRRCVMSAAQAIGNGASGSAISQQQRACDICAEADARLMEAVMRMLLASYFMIAGRDDDSILEYRKAAWRASEAKAYPQLAQCRMACASVWRKRGQVAAAQDEYEQAAAAAAIGQSLILYVESLRMAGVCAVQNSDKAAAFLHWKAAADRACAGDRGSLMHSTALEAAGLLIDLLRKHGHAEHAERVERTVMAAAGTSSEINP